MNKKIAFPKKTTEIRVKEDLGMDYDDVVFKVWDDPSRPVVGDLIMSILTADEDVDKYDAEKFFAAATEYIIDCNIEGLKFDTVEDTVNSFDNPSLPWGFLYEFVTLSMGRLLQKSEKIKKALTALQSNQSSGSVSVTEGEK